MIESERFRAIQSRWDGSLKSPAMIAIRPAFRWRAASARTASVTWVRPKAWLVKINSTSVMGPVGISSSSVLRGLFGLRHFAAVPARQVVQVVAILQMTGVRSDLGAVEVDHRLRPARVRGVGLDRKPGEHRVSSGVRLSWYDSPRSRSAWASRATLSGEDSLSMITSGAVATMVSAIPSGPPSTFWPPCQMLNCNTFSDRSASTAVGTTAGEGEQGSGGEADQAGDRAERHRVPFVR